MAAGRPDVTTRRFGAARPPASGHPLEIIDSHTHATGFDLVNLGRRKIPTGQSALDLAFRCEQNEVDYAACYPIALPFHTDLNRLVHGRAEGIGPEAHPFELINRQHLFECGAQGSGRLLPFVAIDPTSEPVAQMNFVRTCSELIFGLKYHSTIAGQSVAVLEESGFTELASHLDLPFTLHSWLSPDHSRPEHVLAIAERRPQVRINVAHAAGLDASVVRRVASLPNVFIDCSPWQLNLQDYLGHSGTRFWPLVGGCSCGAVDALRLGASFGPLGDGCSLDLANRQLWIVGLHLRIRGRPFALVAFRHSRRHRLG